MSSPILDGVQVLESVALLNRVVLISMNMYKRAQRRGRPTTGAWRLVSVTRVRDDDLASTTCLPIPAQGGPCVAFLSLAVQTNDMSRYVLELV